MDENINTVIQEQEPVSSAPVKKKRTKAAVLISLGIVILLAILLFIFNYTKGNINIYSFIPRTAEKINFESEFKSFESDDMHVSFSPDGDIMLFSIRGTNTCYDKLENAKCINDVLSSREYKKSFKFNSHKTDSGDTYFEEYAKHIENSVDELTKINRELGFSNITKKMLKTKASDKIQTMKSKYATVKWLYTESEGLEVVYENR